MPVNKKLVVLDDPAEFIHTLHPNLKRKIKAALAEILSSPATEGKALRDDLDGYRTYKVGRHRIVYRIRKRIVEIVAVGPRKTIYEDTYKLLKKNIN